MATYSYESEFPSSGDTILSALSESSNHLFASEDSPLVENEDVNESNFEQPEIQANSREDVDGDEVQLETTTEGNLICSPSPRKINTSIAAVFRYNFMVVGHSGSGKSTFCRRMLRRYFDRVVLSNTTTTDFSKHASVDGSSTMKIVEFGRCICVQANGVTIIITIVDTPGFGDTLDNNDRFDPVEQYIVEQKVKYERSEGHRRPFQQEDDTRIHCLLYFLAPHRITPLDREFMRRLQGHVAITPITAKADTMTIRELKKHLRAIDNALKADKIKTFDYQEENIDLAWMGEHNGENAEEDDVEHENSQETASDGEEAAASSWRNGALPRIANIFVVISGERRYPWGTAREDNPNHSDTERFFRVLFEEGNLGRLQIHNGETHEEWRRGEKKKKVLEEQKKKSMKEAEEKKLKEQQERAMAAQLEEDRKKKEKEESRKREMKEEQERKEKEEQLRSDAATREQICSCMLLALFLFVGFIVGKCAPE